MASTIDRVIFALGDCVLPRGGVFPEGAADFQIVQRVRGFVAGQPVLIRRALIAALFLLEWIPFLLGRGRFTQMRPESRVKVIEDCERSRIAPLRNAIHPVKFLILHLVLSDPTMERKLGVRLPCVFAPSLLGEKLP